MTRLLSRLRRWYCRVAHEDLLVYDYYAKSWVCYVCGERRNNAKEA